MTNAVDETVDSDDDGPAIDADDHGQVLPATRALFEGACAHCGNAIKRGDPIAWASGPEKYGAHHVDCQTVNQEPLAREGAPVSLDETTTMPMGDTESMSRAVSALLPERQESEVPTPWQSSVQFVEEANQGIEWLVPDLLPAGAVVLLSGREGSMKTWLAISMARAVAAGLPWIGRPTKPGAVLYLDGEMQRPAFQDRLRRIGPVKDLNIWSRTGTAFPKLLTDEHLRNASSCHTLIVVDTLRRFMGDLKENSSDDMAQVTGALRELAQHGATILVLHHAMKDPERPGSFRGSSELGAGVDVLISLTKKTTGSAARLTLNIEKSRYSFSDKYEIEVTKGEQAPMFSMNSPTQNEGNGALCALRHIIVELRQGPEDPAQNEIIEEAGRRRLGGKDKIRGLLKDGEGSQWHSRRTGKRITYTVIVA